MPHFLRVFSSGNKRRFRPPAANHIGDASRRPVGMKVNTQTDPGPKEGAETAKEPCYESNHEPGFIAQGCSRHLL